MKEKASKEGKEEEGANMSEKISRRQFVRRAVASGLGGWGLGVRGWGQAVPAEAALRLVGEEATSRRSRVVLVRDARVQGEAGELDRDVLAALLDEAVKLAAGEVSAEKAWARFFSSDDRVGLKPNGLGGPSISTATDLIELCLERLDGIGVKAENIIVWERDEDGLFNCGLLPNPDGPGVRMQGIQDTWDEEVTQGSFTGRLTKVVTQQVDAILNLPILKDHNIAGMTLALKNHYGTIANPAAYHANRCNPYCADLNALPAIRDKTRLIIGDALRPVCDGGPMDRPAARWNYNGLLVSTDPVAMDVQGWRILDARREEMGLRPLERVGRKPQYIETAAERGLGVCDPERMEVMERDLGQAEKAASAPAHQA